MAATSSTPAAESSVARADSAGGRGIATVTVTRGDGSIVLRQEVILADALQPGLRVSVSEDGELIVREPDATEQLLELKRIRMGISLLIDNPLDPSTLLP